MSGAYTTYLTAVQNLLGTGSAGNLYTTAQLTGYINEARQHVAEDGQCIRALPPIQGSLSVITVTSGGTGWGACDVVISAPDSPPGFTPYPAGQQASASATSAAGTLTAITILSAGAGYFLPVVTFSGAGAASTFATATVSGVNQTFVNQEVYAFSTINPMVAVSGSGINSIYMVNSISLIWGTFRYTLMRVGWSKYQAYVRNYTAGYTYIPAVYAQFGQGFSGSVYLYPIPNQSYQMEWDCCCIPNDLNNDNDVEALPGPYSEAVKFYAARLAFLQSQRFADAEMMYSVNPQKPGLYQIAMHRARLVSNPRSVSNWYGRSP